MKTMETNISRIWVEAGVNEAQLTDAGREFIAHARGPMGDHLIAIDTVCYLAQNRVDIGGGDDLAYPVVHLTSAITFAERQRRFGVDGLSQSDWSGQIAPGRKPIPTEEYIAQIERAYGNPPCNRVVTLARFCKHGQSLAEAINAAGAEVRHMIENGCFAYSNKWGATKGGGGKENGA